MYIDPLLYNCHIDKVDMTMMNATTATNIIDVLMPALDNSLNSTL